MQRDHADDTVGTRSWMYTNKSPQSSICNSGHGVVIRVPFHPTANTKPHTMNLLSMKYQSHIDMMSTHSCNNNPGNLMQIVRVLPFIQKKNMINPLYIWSHKSSTSLCGCESVWVASVHILEIYKNSANVSNGIQSSVLTRFLPVNGMSLPRRFFRGLVQKKINPNLLRKLHVPEKTQNTGVWEFTVQGPVFFSPSMARRSLSSFR